ncbi:MAG: response regulator [Anaerotruncus sp.]|nr:response regulator [Anaerotruncus sp.]
MKNKTTRFLKVSLAVILVLCIIIFSFLAFYINQKSTETISEVGFAYMQGMSDQVSIHFETTIEMRLSQVEALVDTIPPKQYDDIQALRKALAYTANARGFESLSFYSTDGDFDTIYGREPQLSDPEPFLKSLNNGEKKVAVGTDSSGRKIILLGVSSEYPMKKGEDCTALVASVSVDYIAQLLALDSNSLVYSHIIRKDGSFVIRSGDAFRESYFDRVRAEFDALDGLLAEQYITELVSAMQESKHYSRVLQVKGDRRHVHCIALPYSEWYLVMVMPYGALDQAINNMSKHWMGMMLGSCGLILVALLLMFTGYFRLTQQQMRDLNDARKAAEQANKAKSEFLSNMSHDIRTPMNAIVGMTAIATANIENRQQLQNCLKKITLSSKHLLGLINDVLDMSKIESGKMTLNMDQVSLREVMDSLVSIMQPQVKLKNQQFDVFIHDISVENVCCDSVRLNQVLLNFLSNAVKFTPEGGSIQVAMYEEPSPKGEDYIRIHIQVKDNGIGMSEEFQQKVFESFSREDSMRVHKTEGTGLGMAITKYIVDAMGGFIDVKSALGEGTEFNVTLDMIKADIQEIDMILPDWNMLVVDDDRQLCESTVASLKSIGINAEWALSGESAVEMVDKRCKRHDGYQIILLDWKLPGIDGLETARQIRKHTGDEVPILLISAYDWGEIEDRARGAGISGFIAKPLFKSTLFYGLKRFMGVDGGQPTEELEDSNENFNGKHVLLAEDNDLNWEIAEELLSDLGLQLDRAENGQICVAIFQESPVGYYDAILMDIRMPVMTGYEASQAIRALNRPDADVPIIAMTADAFSEDIKRCLDCGMNAHVAKPIDVDDVAHLLKKHMKTK